MSQAARILLTGSSGFIGSSLKSFLQEKGYDVVCLKRGNPSLSPSPTTRFWDPALNLWNPSDFEGFQAVIHLAGEGIAKSRWTKKRKEQLVLSRLRDTDLLTHILCQSSLPPQLLICASAIGFYGDAKMTRLTEESPQGTGFLANLCSKWEQSAKRVEKRGTRVIHSRFGIVIGRGGGMLHKMLPLFRTGLGGSLGSGKQMMSWISLTDLVRGMVFCLETLTLKGPVNFVSPQPVNQKTFVRILAKKLNRPAWFHVPAWVLRLSLGEMADELLLSSQCVEPKKLLNAGFVFSYANLGSALNETLES